MARGNALTYQGYRLPLYVLTLDRSGKQAGVCCYFRHSRSRLPINVKTEKKHLYDTTGSSATWRTYHGYVVTRLGESALKIVKLCFML